MRKILCVLLALALAVSFLSGCSKKEEEENVSSEVVATPAPTPENIGTRRIGLVQYMEYAPYDKAREAFMSRLEEWGFNDSMVEVDYQNAGGDPAKLTEICEKFVADKDDVVVAISDPAAQEAVKVCGASGPKVVFLGVGDPHGDLGIEDPANPTGSVTGVAEPVTARQAMELALQADGNLEKVGLLYDPTCPFSKKYVEALKIHCEELAIELIEGPATTPQEVQDKMKILCEQAGAVFSPVDSTIAASAKEAAKLAQDAKKPWYVSTEDVVEQGALAGVSYDYQEAGNRAADFAVQLVSGKTVSELPVYSFESTAISINPKVMEALAVKFPAEVLETAIYRESQPAE